jgi:polysaccharide pyruvyl transferase WcaK-like protein
MEADVTAHVPIKRIRVENNSRHHLNVGDVAMLQVAINRLREVFPEAEITVPSPVPDRLLELCPDVHVLDVGRTLDFNPSIIPSSLPLAWRLQKEIGPRLDNWLSRFPPAWRVLAEAFRTGSPGQRTAITDYLDELGSADLVVAPGGGYFNDTFAAGCQSIFMPLLLASGSGTPIGMVGQGLGPATDGALLRLGRTLFPRLSFLGLRERSASLRVAGKMGADPSRTIVTGDDAVELGYHSRKDTLGSKIGFNFRLAAYTETTYEQAEIVRDAVSIFRNKRDVDIVPIPISRQPWEDDLESFRKLFPPGTGDAATSIPVTPAATINLVSECRVVVTSSYHAGVFALSQGIPVLAMVKSQYYIDKFQGLSEQFGCGIRIITLDRSDAAVLTAAIEDLWHDAPTTRPELLRAASAQVEKGTAFYRSIAGMISEPRPQRV